MSVSETSAWPTPADLRAAGRIDLSREPATGEALRFIEAVASVAVQHKTTGRPVAGKGLKTWHCDLGFILGGLLRRNVVASAQRNRSGPMWTPGELPVGLDAFWSKVDAMIAAGLIREERGTRQPHAFQPGSFTGHPTRLWATDALWTIAAAHGLPDAAWKSHWQPLSALVVSQRAPGRSAFELVQLRPLKQAVGRFEEDTGEALPIPPEWVDRVAEIRAGVERLNAGIAAARITGVAVPQFCRIYRHDLRLGGRFYTLNAGGFSSMLKADRRRITINGEPVVEVDLTAAHATIFLALSGFQEAAGRGGLYDFPGLPRAALKAFWTQSLGTGKVAVKWSGNYDLEVRKVSLKSVREAVLRRYPALGDMTAILPPDLLASLPVHKRGWAVGQHLAWHEAETVAKALDAVGEEGIVGLALHDSLVVPESGAGRAEAALSAAFEGRFGVRVGVKTLFGGLSRRSDDAP